jgi:hypothetical protein
MSARVVVAVVCLGVMGCGPSGELASSGEGEEAPDVGEDAGADAEADAQEAPTCEAATCANHDAERLELSIEEGTLTVALQGLPYAVDALTFRGNRVMYVCGICSAGDPECEEERVCDPLDVTPFTAVAAPVDSAFTFAFPDDDDDPFFDGVEWLALEWQDPCGQTQTLPFEGEWDYGRGQVRAPLGCVE